MSYNQKKKKKKFDHVTLKRSKHLEITTKHLERTTKNHLVSCSTWKYFGTLAV